MGAINRAIAKSVGYKASSMPVVNMARADEMFMRARHNYIEVHIEGKLR